MNLYGLTADDLQGIISRQEGLCPLCTADISTGFVVDHDHTTGQVRGLLCHSCNQAIGKFQDDVKIIRAAIDYLK